MSKGDLPGKTRLNQVQVYGAAASRAVDAHAIDNLGVAGYVLMQRAAAAAFACLLHNFSAVKSISVWCGKGNNGGDGYLVARLAHQYGIQTQVVAVVDPADLQGDARLAYDDAVAAGVDVTLADSGASQGQGQVQVQGEVVIDSLLGTGLSGEPRQPFAASIDQINASGKKVLSLDIPSGVSADTGAVYEHAVRANVTISFITKKIGLYTGQGVSQAGLRLFDDLGVPDHMYVADGVPLVSWHAGVLPELDANTYKHRQGHVLVAGGDNNMPGAVAMAAEAALRVGAGMVTVLTRSQHAAPIIARTPEVMVSAYSASGRDIQTKPLEAQAGAPSASELLQRADVVVLGPGLGRSAWSQSLYSLAEQSNKTTVLDADGLYWLAESGSWQGGPLIITPHIAEAARLLGCSGDEVQQDRLAACRQLQQRYNCQGVLKGAGSIVFGAETVMICAHGNPGMATAGMGDVLSGVLGGLLAGAQETPLNISPRLSSAVALHSAAADQAAMETGQRSLLATDVINKLPMLLRGES